MTKLYANAKWIENMRIDVDDDRTHAICLDLQPDDGTDMGPSALELSLMSLAGCYATIFALTAKKMRVATKYLKVHLEAIKSEKAGTITEAKLNISASVDASRDRLQRVHELTIRNCPVGKLFEKAGVKLNYNLKTENQ